MTPLFLPGLVSTSTWTRFGMVPAPKVCVSQALVSAVAWPMLMAGRIVIVVAPADGSKAAIRTNDRAERLTKVIVGAGWRILTRQLMKIVRGNRLFRHVERLETGGSHGEYAVDVLHFAIDNQVGVIKDSGSLAIENVGHDDGVRNTGFVFDAEE